MERWKAIEGTNGMIEVSTEGRVRSLLRGTPSIIKTFPDHKGYHRIRVTINRQKMTFKLHRQVALLFIPNPEGKPQVNHIDGCKDNNAVSNLEWCTNRENAHHAIATGLWDSVYAGAKRANEAQRKPIIGYCEAESIQKEFVSVGEAEKFLNSRHISDVLKGKRQHVKGWTFAYKGGDAI